ncbi:MAG: hypothetical protein U0441_31845 [Polyangiaceae bacterium]
MSNSNQRPPPRRGTPPPVTLADLSEARALRAQLDPAVFAEETDPQAWLFDPEVQRILAEVIDEEAAPYTHLLPPEDLEALRREVEAAAHIHPTPIEYLGRLRPRAVPDGSGKTKKGTFRAPATVVPFRSKKTGGESA